MIIWLSRNLRLRENNQSQIMQEYCIPYLKNICFGYLLDSPQWGDSNKYSKHMTLCLKSIKYNILWGDSNKSPKHMFYEEIQTKLDLSYIPICSLSYSVQQQIHFNGNIFEKQMLSL